MILLGPPYRIVDGHAVLPDHADPGLFYVIPQTPQLRVADDGHPDLSLVQYLGGGAGADRLEGGLLTLTVELGVSDEQLQAIGEKLAGTVDGSVSEVTPILFAEGTVELVALGRSSVEEDEDDNGESTGTGLEVSFLGSGKPSLGGNNLATFQLILDANAAQLVEQALDAPDLPMIAVYQMAFSGLRPSYEIQVDANWEHVYRSLQQRLQANLYYVAADVETSVTEALEESGIDVETMVLGAGEGDRAAAERARKQLLEWVMDRMFEPVIDPELARTAAVGDVVDSAISSLVRAVVPGASYRLKAVDETQLRLMSARMNESVAERREAVPQGTLGSLLRQFREDEQGNELPEWPDLKRRMVQKLSLDGFPRLEVRLAVEDRFQSDGLSSVMVDMARPGAAGEPMDERSFTIRSADEREDYVVNLLGDDAASFDSPYMFRGTVTFDPAGHFGPHSPITGGWQSGRAAELFVEPRILYMVRDIKVGVTPTFSFEQFPAVTVELKSGAGPDADTDRIELSPESPEQVWRFRSFTAKPEPYTYKVLYHRTPDLGGNIEVEWKEHLEDYLSIADPIPRKRMLNLFVSLPWDEIQVAFVQLRYRDAPNGIQIDEQIDLNSETAFVQRVYPIAAEGPRSVSYRLTLLLATGQLLEGAWRVTEEDRLVLDRRLVEEGVINFRVLGGTLEDQRLEQVKVELQVRENGDAVREETSVSIRSDSGPPESWTFLLGDPPIRTVHYRGLFVARDGFVKRTPWESTDSDLLVVHLGNQTVSG